jgi:hypothetical protein
MTLVRSSILIEAIKLFEIHVTSKHVANMWAGTGLSGATQHRILNICTQEMECEILRLSLLS